MRAVVQRVSEARVSVAGQVVGEIGAGLLVLVGVTHGDTADTAAALARKVHGLRILRGERSVADGPDDSDGSDGSDGPDGSDGSGRSAPAILAVSQFTLYGDPRRGRRPSWAAAAPGPVAEPVFEAFVAWLRTAGASVSTGVFGADMRVGLVNDGPVTLVLDSAPGATRH